MRTIPSCLLAAVVLCAGTGATGVRAGVLFGSLLSFDGTNGANPAAALAQGADTRLYGTATAGGLYQTGTVFRISLDSTGFTNLYAFRGDTNGAIPSAGLVQAGDGVFYGTTFGGGVSNCGTVYRITASGTLVSLAAFANTDGAGPTEVMTRAEDGSFYGTTDYGGAHTNFTSGGFGYGVVFRVTTNGTLTTPVMFHGTNGANPRGLIRGRDGSFYGTTAWGGDTSRLPLGFGTVFKLAPDGTFTNLYLFSGFGDGGFVYAGLVQGEDGTLYGATFGGGLGFGTLFQISTNGQFASLYSFTGGGDGANPAGTMLFGPDGKLYGTTYTRGANGFGTAFQFDPKGTGVTLVSFTGMAGNYPGANPSSRLLVGNDGNLYGVTPNGGSYNAGTLFRISVPMPPRLLSVVRTNGNLRATWSAVAGQTYQVEYTSDLSQTGWNNLGSAFTATNGTVDVSDPIGPDRQRFYRLALLP
jgi:uncharacterized repeat protein (TIGR03803 family)